MRQFNLPLNQAKLDTKVIQLKSIEAQYSQLETKLAEVKQRLLAKQVEVSQMSTAIDTFKHTFTK